MAFLHDTKTGQRCFLYAHHSFGRLAYAVDTVIEQSQISKHHAIIEWQDDYWSIRDLSRNGTWLNHTKLVENTRYLLNINDKIYFSDPGFGGFVVADLDAPADLLIALNNSMTVIDSRSHPHPDSAADSVGNGVIRLAQYHLLPDEYAPELAIFIDPSRQQWRIERFNQQLDAVGDEAGFLNEHDVIDIGGQSWRLQLSHFDMATEQLQMTQNPLTFVFQLSLDEEDAQLRLQTAQQRIDFHVRSHHYLTLNLARYRAADAANGIEQSLQGWVYPQQLVRDIGIDLTHLNIQVHRARKQFTDLLNNRYDARDFIQRRNGKVRFGGSSFKIYKGRQLEYESPAVNDTGHYFG